MGIGLKPEFDKNAIRKASLVAIGNSKRRIVDYLVSVGRDFIKSVQSSKEFTNHTFSLISSIGFVVAIDGDIAHREFIDGGNSVGQQKGIKVATDALTKINGVMLVCVAGEDYALYVESKGKDVITGSSQYVSTILKGSLGR